MKVLYLTIDKAEYLADLLFHGLVKVLGRENMISFVVDSHMAKEKYDLYNRQDNTGLLEAVEICHYEDLGIQEKWYNTSEIIDLVNEGFFDFVFINRPYWMDKKWLKGFLDNTKCSFVVLESDSTITESLKGSTTKLLRDRILLYFQKEKLPSDNITKPLQFALPLQDVLTEPRKKEFSVSFLAGLGGTGREYRAQVAGILNKMNLKNSVILHGEQVLPRRLYLDIISKSYISVSIRGERFDCPRFYEIIGQKTLCLSNRLPIDVWKPFANGEQVVYFDSLADIPEIIQGLLDNPKKCELIAGEGYRHLLRYHTTIERAKYVLKELQSA